MNALHFLRRTMAPSRLVFASIAVAGALAATPVAAPAADMAVKLTGGEEVPPVDSPGSGSGTITIGADKSVSGSVTTQNVPGTMAHIHMAAAGKNGPVIIPLEKKGDGMWAVPAGAKLTDEQAMALAAGQLYVNVHTDAHKGGEIRAQLKP